MSTSPRCTSDEAHLLEINCCCHTGTAGGSFAIALRSRRTL